MNATLALGWTLVHFLWQGAAIAGLLALTLWCTAHRTATTRYALSLVALALMTAAPIVTGFRIYDAHHGTASIMADAADADGVSKSENRGAEGMPQQVDNSQTTTLSAASVLGSLSIGNRVVLAASRVRRALRPTLPWLVGVWLVGVVLLSARLLGGLASSRTLIHRGTKIASSSSRVALQRMARRLKMSRSVKVLESTVVQVPAVIGWLRPVILLPVSALTGLSAQQIDALLAHELAHIRRHDYAVNLLQTIVETLLFYHPAIWWVSARIRQEREFCCDDIAVSVSGDARVYAEALAEMEHLRTPAPQLVTAARGGPLLSRVRRLMEPSQSRDEVFPRWIAGAVAVVAALIVGGSTQLSAVQAQQAENNEPLLLQATLEPANIWDEPAADIAGESTQLSAPQTLQPEIHEPMVRPTREATPNSLDESAENEVVTVVDQTQSTNEVIRHSGDGPLRDRFTWAYDRARDEGFDTYWVGYAINPNPNIVGWTLVKQSSTHVGGGTFISGRFTGQMRGYNLPGVGLGPLVGDHPPDHSALLFGYEADNRGRPTLTQVYVSSFGLPVDLDEMALLWLGDADDDESLPVVEEFFDNAQSPRLMEFLVNAVGMHGTSQSVVPLLTEWLSGNELNNVREEAADWLGYHPTPAALYALSRAARRDRVSDVQEEAAEAIGYLNLPAATDTLISLARTLSDHEVRAEAVESLGGKDGNEAIQALATIAREDASRSVQEEAVETLGEIRGGRGLDAIIGIARSHPSSVVRREAMETIGEAATADRAVSLLEEFAQNDPNSDVQQEAVETLGEIEHERVAEILFDVAQNHARAGVQQEAVETLGEVAGSSETVRMLTEIAESHARTDVQREAVETLGEIRGAGSEEAIASIARTHPRADVREEAIETYGETVSNEEALELLIDVAHNDPSTGVRREAVETLGEIRGARATAAIAGIARNHPQTDVREEAIETYAESASADSAIALLKELAVNDPSLDIQEEAVEALAEFETDAAVDAIIEIAASHPNRRIRVEAIEHLADSRHPRAEAAIRRLIQRP